MEFIWFCMHVIFAVDFSLTFVKETRIRRKSRKMRENFSSFENVFNALTIPIYNTFSFSSLAFICISSKSYINYFSCNWIFAWLTLRLSYCNFLIICFSLCIFIACGLFVDSMHTAYTTLIQSYTLCSSCMEWRLFMLCN